MDLQGRQKYAVLGLLALGLAVLAGLAARSYSGFSQPPADVQILQPDSKEPEKPSSASQETEAPDAAPASGETPSTPAAGGNVTVHMAGMVRKPGLYTLPSGARVNDGLKAAGGAKSNADLDAVNLAARLVDGEQVYLPAKGSGAAPAALAVETSSSVPSVRGAASSLSPRSRGRASSSAPAGPVVVNINTANESQLDRLPGVGPATARSILEYRKAAGGFVRPEDIMNVRGIGEKKFAKMKAYIVVR